jgi:hypothetical protein
MASEWCETRWFIANAFHLWFRIGHHEGTEKSGRIEIEWKKLALRSLL